MARVLTSAQAGPVVQTMLGACDVDGGPTAEQLAIIRALALGYFGLAGLDGLQPLAPQAASEHFDTTGQRRRVRELLVLLELCRHPIGAEQVDRVEEYARALDADDDTMVATRRLLRQSHQQAIVDYWRLFDATTRPLLEESIAQGHDTDMFNPVVEPELAARLRGLEVLPSGTLGRAYLAFYAEHGLALPGEGLPAPAIYLAHDMTHVIAGYGPDGIGEIALGFMQLGIADSDEHWVLLLGTMCLREAGFLTTRTAPDARLATMTRPGAPEIVAHAMARGARCSGDFSEADHLALVDQPLEDVRAEFGVPPL